MLNLDKFIERNSAVLICTEFNRRKVSGVKSSEGHLLLTQVGNFLLVDSRYFEMAQKKALPNIKVILLERFSKQVNDLINRFGIDRIYTETGITYSYYQMLNDILHCEVVPSKELSDCLIKDRSVKTDKEIEYITSALRIAEESLDEVLNFVKVGRSEREIATELEYIMSKKGSEGKAFDSIVVSGPNSSLPHGVPTDRKIADGDFLTFDFGATVNGYRSDITRTFGIGNISEKMKEIYSIVYKAQLAAIDSIKAGVKAGVVDSAARDIIVNEGYAGNFRHSVGHGVGLDIHEFPNISPGNETVLEKNQVVTVEPGIYIPEKFGVRIEDMIVVGENTRQNLTKQDKTLIIL